MILLPKNTRNFIHLISLIIIWWGGQVSIAQTVLEKGDVSVIGVNANNLCGGYSGSDVISIVFFKDITTNTAFWIADFGFISENSEGSIWHKYEGTVKFKYNGATTIPRGTVLRVYVQNNTFFIDSETSDWEVIFAPTFVPPTFNINTYKDQVFILNDEGWTKIDMNEVQFDGKILYGMNTSPNWCTSNCDVTSDLEFNSRLPESIDPCLQMLPINDSSPNESITAEKDRTYNLFNTSNTEPTTVQGWIKRIKNPDNWVNYPGHSSHSSCNAYNNADTSRNNIAIVDLAVNLSAAFPEICAGTSTTLNITTNDPDITYLVSISDGETTYNINVVPGENGGVGSLEVSPTTTSTYTITSISPNEIICPFEMPTLPSGVTVTVTPAPITSEIQFTP